MSVTERVSSALAQRVSRTQGLFASPARTARTTVVIGRLLATAFLICFLTGLYSHLLQEPLPGMRFPTWPGVYAFTQGLHVTVGIAIFPLLLGKLWTVYPRLFVWPPVASVPEFFERASIAVLVSSALLEPTIGLINTYQWYPWPFPFRQTHFALAWVIVGSIVVHVGVKLPTIVRYWRRRSAAVDRSVTDER
jgi:cytochrome b561